MLAFARLSFSLLVSSFLLACSALPVQSSDTELLVLTPDNFQTTISEGVWLVSVVDVRNRRHYSSTSSRFIEHFSPYCHHCRAFAPLWEQLVKENEAKADPGIHMAQVNCAVHGGTPASFIHPPPYPLPAPLSSDLCSKNKVDGYPQMNLYRNGEFVETFRQSREHDILTNYLVSHAEPRNPPAAESTPEDNVAVDPIEPENDPLVEEYVSRQDMNPQGLVLSLDEKNYQQTVDNGHVFIKFFAPWSVPSRVPRW